MTPEVSIIIPVYNVEAFLPECLASVERQTVFEKLEVILVNDGSTDTSMDICSKFAAAYPNVTIITQSNKGLSEARNNGMMSARGKYIYFLDSDDLIEPDAIATLTAFAKVNDCDIVQGNHYYAYPDKLLALQPIDGKCVFGVDTAMKLLVENRGIHNFVWSKLYRRELVNSIKFQPDVYFEDFFWMHLVLDRVSRFGIVNKPLYHYRQRDSSITGTFSIKNFDLLKGYLERLTFISYKYPHLVNALKRNIEHIFMSFYPFCKPGSGFESNFHTYLSAYASVAGSRSLTMRMLTSRSYKLVELILLIKRICSRVQHNKVFVKPISPA